MEMSRAFVKDTDADAVEDLPDRPVSEHPNDVTAEGLAQIEAAVAAAQAALGAAHGAGDRAAMAQASRDLRYWSARRATARVVPDAELEAAAAIYVDPMLKTAPLGLRITKETLNTALKVGDLHAVIDLEERAQSICGRGPDFEEAMKAFLEKREPRYAAPA